MGPETETLIAIADANEMVIQTNLGTVNARGRVSTTRPDEVGAPNVEREMSSH